jgi:hypothetical protein
VNSVDGRPSPTWWSPRRIATAAAVAVVLGAAAFLFRFNALGGTLGGFDNDHFTRLIRADVLLQGQQPLRDFVDSELRGAWPALTYAMSAWAQQIGGRTLLSEAYLTVGSLTLAFVIVFLLALDVSKRWSIALLATIAAIVTMPKVHNYPKVLTLTLGAWALRAVAVRPSAVRLAAAALATAIATLFRHDYGVYVAVGIAATLLARDVGQWQAAARSVATYGALTALWLMPSAIWVQAYGGIPQYISNALTTVAAERTRTPLELSEFNSLQPFAGDGPEVISYYAFWAIPTVAAIVLAMSLMSAARRRKTDELAVVFGLLAMTVIVNFFFLRANLTARFGDAAVPLVLLAASVAGLAASLSSTALRASAIGAQVGLLAIVLGSGYVYSEVARELDTSGLSDSREKTARRYREVRDELGRLPPSAWTDAQAAGTLRAARYVAECTAPADRLLVIGRLHEIPVFARRQFAAGQPLFELSLFTSDVDQRLAVQRLQEQSVPIVLAESSEFEEGFVSDYPLVAQYLTEHYREAGVMKIDEEPRLLVLVEKKRAPVRTDPASGFPCFR